MLISLERILYINEAFHRNYNDIVFMDLVSLSYCQIY